MAPACHLSCERGSLRPVPGSSCVCSSSSRFEAGGTDAPTLGLALFVAGGASNWIDRVARGSVVDFLNVGIETRANGGVQCRRCRNHARRRRGRARDVLQETHVVGAAAIYFTMLYRLMADAVVVVHLGFVGFVVLGGLLALRWPRAACGLPPARRCVGRVGRVHGRICPLTPLENFLRRQGGDADYSASFVEHYVIPVLYPAALTREFQWVLGGIVIAVNAAVYAVEYVEGPFKNCFLIAEARA